MKYLLVILLIGIALYYAMKWKKPTDQSNMNSNNSDSNPYNSKKKKQQNFQKDSGPYSSAGSSSNKQTSGSGSSYAKWIGGGLGWAFGGPIGGILGFMVGSMFQGGGVSSQYGRTQSGDFSLSLLILTAAVMKADGSVRRSELDYVKRFLENNFGPAKAPEYVKMLGQLLKQDYSVGDVAGQISQFMDYGSRMMLLQFLFGIAQADGNNHPDEVEMIKKIASFMGISSTDYESIKAMFIKETSSAYKVLGVDSKASNDDIKKAYRVLEKEHHPDRVAHLGEDVKKAAEIKFTKLNAAYDAIKEERGMN